MAAGWPCSSGCLGTTAGLGGGGPKPGLLLGGNAPLGFRHEQRVMMWRSYRAVPGHLSQKGGGKDMGRTEF